MDENYWMSEEEYGVVTGKSVVPCIDLVILRKSSKGELEVLLLVRKTGYGADKWCIIGGRQWKGERIREAIDRQAKDLGIKVEVIPPFEPGFPAWIHDDPNQDKTKHPCSITYPVRIISGQVREGGEEYKGYKWFSVNNLPSGIAFHHEQQILKTIYQLKKFNALNGI
jgi:ADP-ribose pyrophosphatase YjhB (NUDIX family)